MADLFSNIQQQAGGFADSVKSATSGLTAENIVTGLLRQDNLKDWNHASQLFTTNKNELHPKQSFLFHVFFELNLDNGPRPDASISQLVGDPNKRKELGMLVKQVSLPKFSIDTKSLNAYNRPHIVQTKIHYDPITITFHDDSADVVRNFWYDYYTYYYRNSDHGSAKNPLDASASHRELTSPRLDKDWGYTIRGQSGNPAPGIPYLRSIRIYSLHNKKFSEYVLTNPIIKSFQHGEHSSSEGTGIMQHTMTVEFESIHYASGKVSKKGNTYPLGFGDIHYDHVPSPLTAAGGGTRSLLGPGGLVETSEELYEDLSDGNYLLAAFKGAKTLNGLKGQNIGAIVGAGAVSGLLGLGKSYVNGGPNPFGSVSSPTGSNTSTGLPASSPIITEQNENAQTTGEANSGGPFGNSEAGAS